MNYTRDEVYGCHRAIGRSDHDGYVFHGARRAHLIAWEAVNGPVPGDMVIDHLCRRRDCCAPHHLEAVTQRENLKRRSWRYRARMGACPKGHPLSSNAVITPEGGRVCRTCNREA